MDNDYRPFSEREGFRAKENDYKINPMPDSLRNKLWNLIYDFYLDDMRHCLIADRLIDSSIAGKFIRKLWFYKFELPFDDIYYDWRACKFMIKDKFLKCDWYFVYDLLEFFAIEYRPDVKGKDFAEKCNDVFKDENAPYRFINFLISPITSDIEKDAVDKALSWPLDIVKIHLQTALKHFSDRKSPDYRNSIAESIKALESICRIIAKNSSATLAEALKNLEEP